MSEYEPLDFEADSRRLINELTDVGHLAGLLVSRAAKEHGDHHPVTDLFDNVAQRLTVTILEFQTDLLKVEQ